MSQSRITRIVTWVRVESARKIWVRHNPAGYQYYFPFTLFGKAQCFYLIGVSNYCAPHQIGTLHLYYGPSALTPAMSPHVSGAIPLSALPLPVSPHPPRPVLAGCPARIGSTEWPWSAGLDSTWVDRRSRSFTSLPPLPLPQHSYYDAWSDLPFLGRVHLHTDRDRSATWCRVTYIVNTLYSSFVWLTGIKTR